MADVRLAELCAATSLFTDLGTGHPAEHAMRTCLVAMRLADELRFTVFERSDLYFTALSRFLGCTADAHETAAVAGGDERAFYAALAPATMGSRYEQVRGLIGAVAPGAPPARRARRVARALADPSRAERLLSAHCEVGQRLAARMHLGDGVVAALAAANARWDGAGVPALGGEAIPRVMRVAIVARDLVLGSGRDPADLLLRRRGRAYDPTVVDAAIALGVDELTRRPAGDLWDETIAAEPDPVRHVSEEQIGDVLEALADFSDLKLPDLAGHSRGVADLAAGAARALGFGAQRVRRLKHAGLAARPRPGRGSGRHVDATGPARHQPVGAGSSARVLRRAHAVALPRRRGPGAVCGCPSRTSRRIGLPPRLPGARPESRSPAPCRR